MQFEFATATKIVFGSGILNSIGDIATGMGNRALIVSGGPPEASQRIRDLLDHHGISSNILRAQSEPTVDAVQNAVRQAKEASTEFIIGIGGGSALDTAKATASLSNNSGDVTDYLEVIGSNRRISNPSLPLIAIPTTAGTGAEVTKNAVIGSPAQRVKVSLRSPFLLPRVALIDPELTLSVPADVTAYTGMDTLTQLIEPFTCITPSPITDAICLEGFQHVARSFTQAYDDGANLLAREDMSLASLFSGIALANAKLGAVHGLAGPVGGEIPAHHGAVCAKLLPEVLVANRDALTALSPDHPVLGRYRLIAKLLTGDGEATIDTLIQWVRALMEHMKIRSLSEYGLSEGLFSVIIEKASRSSSMKGNPVTLSESDLRNILQRSL